MRATSIVWIAAAALAIVRPSLGADVVAWGSAVNGVRLGIDFDPASSEPVLRVFLRNTGDTPVEILIGRQTGKGTAVDFKFTAVAPDGKVREGFEINTFTPIAGLLCPQWFNLVQGVSTSCASP